MPAKTPPSPFYPAWSTARYWSFIRSGLRKCWTRYPPKFETLKEGRRNVTGKRHRFEYKCAICNNWFQQKLVQIDHIIPTGSLNCIEDVQGFVERMFPHKDDLRILCKPCHKEITAKEREAIKKLKERT